MLPGAGIGVGAGTAHGGLADGETARKHRPAAEGAVVSLFVIVLILASGGDDAYCTGL